MTASKVSTATFSPPGRNLIDIPVAALAGLSVAFAAFTIPADLLGEAVGATGLASVFSAAQPPLGSTARLAMAVAGALTAFVTAFLLLRWLDRFAARPAGRAPSPPFAEADRPRLRKADAHPDAPPRRPISASRDLGEPAPPRPSVDWLDDLQPLAAPTPRAAPSPRAAPVAPAAAPSAPAAVSPPPASLAALMGRLEQGLVKRETIVQAAPRRSQVAVDSPTPAAPVGAAIAPPAPTPAAPVEAPIASSASPPPPVDRLQSAIDSLQRLAARG